MSEAILRRPTEREAADAAPGLTPGLTPALTPAPSPRLWLARLALSGFRCYDRVELEADGRPVVLCGPNGAGKTNLLEAVSLLAPGRGLRRARLSEMARRPPHGLSQGLSHGEADREAAGGSPEGSPWAVAATIVTPEGPREIGTGRELASGPGAGDEKAGERRVVKIDGAPVRGQQGLGEILSLVWLTPQMDGLLREAPSARRRFLDRLVYGFDPAHAGRVAAYEQSLRERARLLKLGQGDDAWLGALEDGMARHGIAIAAARRALVRRLAAACAEQESAFPAAGLALAGEVEAWLEEGSALMAEDRLRGRLAEGRARDGQAGGAGAGPHRSDLMVRHLERGMAAELCSTGEQKALLVSIVLAHARLLTLERGAPPLLLLDEVAAHLDAVRREALYSELRALGAQAWLTGTEAAVFAPLRGVAQFLRVENAALSPLSLSPMPPADN